MKRKRNRWAERAGLAALLAAMLGWLAIAAAADPGVNYRIRLPIIFNNWPKPPVPLYLPLVARPEPPPPPVTVDLSVSRVEIIQGITLSDPYTVQVAHRPAMMRVFLNLSGADSQTGVFARLTRYVGGTPQDSLIEGPITALPATDEGNLGQTLNFALPQNWLEPGTAYVIEIDPDGTIDETDEGNNRFPGGGDQSFDFQNAPALEVTIVPVRYARPGAPVTQPPLSDLSYLTWMPIKVYPLSQINYTVRGGFYTFSGDLRTTDGWSDLLSDITNLHSIEDLPEHQLFFGLVDSVGADGCSGGCIAGIGWVNGPPGGNPGYASKTAVGFAGFDSSREAASPTFTHEMGHNFGRLHAPCGTSNGVGFFPYNNAAIGQWGFDIASSQLYDPGSYRDFMSYCGPEWTSDYTYKSIFDAWTWVTDPFGAGAKAAAQESLVVSGYRETTGAWHVAPARTQLVPGGPASAEGPLLLELLSSSGEVLASQPFALQPMSLDRLHSGVDLAGFRVPLPVIDNATGFRIRDGAATLFERQVSGAAPELSGEASWTAGEAETRLTWPAAAGQPNALSYDVHFSPDGGASWMVLALGQATPEIPVARNLFAGASAPIVEVQASDGVRTRSRVYPVPVEILQAP